MDSYYDQKLAAERLVRVYDLATPRIKQYLQMEIETVTSRIKSGDDVLELGCGYGRALKPMVSSGGSLFGIDLSLPSLKLAREYCGHSDPIHFTATIAGSLALADEGFDVVFGIQNGISAFKEDRLTIISESLRVLIPGGRLLLSSYSEKIWDERLHWFELQYRAGLMGAIDYTRTGDGKIICTDGFTADTIDREEFLSLAGQFHHSFNLFEVDDSSLFLEIIKS